MSYLFPKKSKNYSGAFVKISKFFKLTSPVVRKKI